MINMRIGFGYDIHVFAPNRKLFIGGVELDYKLGLKGHSDADVLIHAICDALLGAANMRDIGFNFPDNSDDFKNIDSKILLKKTINLLSQKNYKICNIDCTVCAENPKINPYIPEIQKTLAPILEIPEDSISIKATTNEKVGFVGREEGITAYAVALIYKN